MTGDLLRQLFNRNFSQERYERFLTLVSERAGCPVPFRLAETPCSIYRDKRVREQLARHLGPGRDTTDEQGRFVFTDESGFGDYRLLYPIWDERNRIRMGLRPLLLRGVDLRALATLFMEAIRTVGPVAFFAGMAILPAFGAPMTATRPLRTAGRTSRPAPRATYRCCAASARPEPRSHRRERFGLPRRCWPCRRPPRRS